MGRVGLFEGGWGRREEGVRAEVMLPSLVKSVGQQVDALLMPRRLWTGISPLYLTHLPPSTVFSLWLAWRGSAWPMNSSWSGESTN